MMFRSVFLAFGLILSVSCSVAEDLDPRDLPYQQATGVDDGSGKRVIKYWSESDARHPDMRERWVPDRPEFAGAELWHIGVEAAQLEEIVHGAFSKAGMTNVRLLAKRDVNPLAVSIASSIPNIRVTAIMVSGQIGHKQANGIGYVFYGIAGDEPGVSAFMAPSNIFVALGGHTIPEVHWYLGTTPPDHDLIAEGELAPQAAVDEASAFFSLWVASYVAPLKGIQQSSLQMMQSWNNAMNVCSGDPNCTVVPSSDGSGNWEPRIQ